MSRLAILASVVAVASIGVACAETGGPSNSASSMLTGPSAFAASTPDGAAVSAPAAKGGQGKGGGGGNTGGSYTFALRMVTETTVDGLPNWGERVTFDVSTTATTQPHVSLTCSQNGVVVYGAEAGYYETYPSQTMQLTSRAWQGGAASCVAKLYYFSGTNIINLGSISFIVAA